MHSICWVLLSELLLLFGVEESVWVAGVDWVHTGVDWGVCWGWGGGGAGRDGRVGGVTVVPISSLELPHVTGAACVATAMVDIAVVKVAQLLSAHVQFSKFSPSSQKDAKLGCPAGVAGFPFRRPCLRADLGALWSLAVGSVCLSRCVYAPQHNR